MKNTRLYVGALSDKGSYKPVNQDNILVKIGEYKEEDFGMFIVADGVGGLSKGEKASEICINTFKNWWDEALIDFIGENGIKNLEDEIDGLIKMINMEIIMMGKAEEQKIGTTLSMLFIYKDEYLIKHIGDSRIYKFDGNFIKLTEDHTWVSRQVKDKLITEEEAKKHPRRNVLTQCLGVKEDIEIYEAKGKVTSGEIFIVCSDGFYHEILLTDIKKIAESYSSISNRVLQEIVNYLVDVIKERGERDNISAIIISAKDEKDDSGIWSQIKKFLG